MNIITWISVGIVAVLAASVAAQPTVGNEATRPPANASTATHQKDNEKDNAMQQHTYVGMWVTADAYIRHELLPNGRYDEARGNRESDYQGRYEIRGNQINYWDDTGFTADGTFVSQDELHHGGMVLFRQK
ncbi:Atu4866 domain-containing protein [Bordetella tumulicola]|uniref:Atu4866 domain-containing protein n=1 Tax=Bordetella tumulicola TaxID=1649133 RepID=UPI0039F0FDBD